MHVLCAGLRTLQRAAEFPSGALQFAWAAVGCRAKQRHGGTDAARRTVGQVRQLLAQNVVPCLCGCLLAQLFMQHSVQMM